MHADGAHFVGAGGCKGSISALNDCELQAVTIGEHEERVSIANRVERFGREFGEFIFRKEGKKK